MKNFFSMFWNDKSVAERVTRAMLIGVGATLITMEDPWMKALGAGVAALGAAIGAGEKNEV